MTELSVIEAMGELDVSRRQIHLLIKRGRLAARRDPDGLRRVWLDAEQLARYKASRHPLRDDARRALRTRMRRGDV